MRDQKKKISEKPTWDDVEKAMLAMSAYKSDMPDEFIHHNFGVENADYLNNQEFVRAVIEKLKETKK